MPRFKSRAGLERNAEGDLWKNTLSKITTVFGRLAYLASLRDPNSGIYRHHGLTVAFGRDESIRALREQHEQIFYEWLNLPLADKSSELSSYMLALDDPTNLVLEHWVRNKPYATYPPAVALNVERDLFIADLEALIAAFRNGSRS